MADTVSPSKTTTTSGRAPWSWIILITVVVAALVGTYLLFVEPPPPKKIIIATGSTEGAYYKFAKEYAVLLSKEGVELEVRATKGSVENLELLQDEQTGVGVALVQSGVAGESARAKLMALGSLYREPLWVFHQAHNKPKEGTLRDLLAGKRLAIGPQGSGTRSIALLLLKSNDLLPVEASAIMKTELREEAGVAAAEGLKKGDLDAAFFVASIETPFILDLLKNRVPLVSMNQQSAYLQRFHFLAGTSLPPGLIDLGNNIPDHEIKLVAPTAMLVARKDLHPALVALLLTTAAKVHGPGDLLSHPDEFPSPQYLDLPLSEEARHFYKSGPPVLQRFMPFWLASMADRLKVMLIPLVMLLMPLFRSAPPLMRWRARRKIYCWYTNLRLIDLKILQGLSGEEARAELTRLQAMELQIAQVEVPLSYMEEIYNLRGHLTLIDAKLRQKLGNGTSEK